MAKKCILIIRVKRCVEFGLEDAPDDTDYEEEEVPEHFTETLAPTGLI